ncbi:uncharacterized protein mIF3 isoform X2 [Cloeon dipterum]|uniref:uncharacterized protein mIF3 isoform X2 n=1 Tax=Cloeon dipterum TaxID=197152 RepID=UPI00321FD303
MKINIDLDIEFYRENGLQRWEQLRSHEPFIDALDRYIDELRLKVSADLEDLALKFEGSDHGYYSNLSGASRLEAESQNQLLGQSDDAEESTKMSVSQLCTKFEKTCAPQTATPAFRPPTPHPRKLSRSQLAPFTQSGQTNGREGEMSVPSSPVPEIASLLFESSNKDGEFINCSDDDLLFEECSLSSNESVTLDFSGLSFENLDELQYSTPFPSFDDELDESRFLSSEDVTRFKDEDWCEVPDEETLQKWSGVGIHSFQSKPAVSFTLPTRRSRNLWEYSAPERAQDRDIANREERRREQRELQKWRDEKQQKQQRTPRNISFFQLQAQGPNPV